MNQKLRGILQPRRQHDGTLLCICPCCQHRSLEAWKADGDGKWQFGPCAKGCFPADVRDALRIECGHDAPSMPRRIETAQDHLTGLLAAFVQLAEMLPTQFHKEAAPLLHQGMRAAGGLSTELAELSRRFATHT